MKKRFWAVPLAVVASIGVSSAVDLHPPHVGLGCPEGFAGRYHFVNNQIPEGTAEGTLNATWSSGDTCTVAPYKVLSHVQHFLCTGKEGTILSASTNLPGKLVLSDYTCRLKKCDPKVDPKCPV